jgi:hypothetical protein
MAKKKRIHKINLCPYQKIERHLVGAKKRKSEAAMRRCLRANGMIGCNICRLMMKGERIAALSGREKKKVRPTTADRGTSLR